MGNKIEGGETTNRPTEKADGTFVTWPQRGDKDSRCRIQHELTRKSGLLGGLLAGLSNAWILKKQKKAVSRGEHPAGQGNQKKKVRVREGEHRGRWKKRKKGEKYLWEAADKVNKSNKKVHWDHFGLTTWAE